MPKTAINRNPWNPYERFVDRDIRVPPPKTPVVTLPPRRNKAKKIRTRKDINRGKEHADFATIQVSDIIPIVASLSGFSVKDILGRRRTWRLVKSRQVAMWACRRLAAGSLPLIGDAMGGRNHTTVLHGVRVVDRTIDKTNVTPITDSPAGWIISLLEAHSWRKRQPKHEAFSPLPAVRQQAMETRCVRKNGHDTSLQGMDGRGGLVGGDGGAGQWPTDRDLQAPDRGVSPHAEAAA